MNKEIVLIAVVASDGGIGVHGDLLWHLPGDLKHFKQLTSGHPVIMGRKTWESLPKRPLPGRQNIVLTGDGTYIANGAETADSVVQALNKAEGSRVFVIGGGNVYRQLLPFATELQLTEVDAIHDNADTYFPKVNKREWFVKSSEKIEEKGLTYRFVTYKRR